MLRRDKGRVREVFELEVTVKTGRETKAAVERCIKEGHGSEAPK